MINQLMIYLYQQHLFSFSNLESFLKTLHPLEAVTYEELKEALLNHTEAASIHNDIKSGVWENHTQNFIKKLNQHDIKFIFRWDDAYPISLLNIPSPPVLLYYQGFLPPEQNLSIAIVGARKATPVGCQVAREISADLGRAGVSVISGLAEGIDTSAHEGALQGNGYTLAVLGCGLFRNYPASNLGLRRKILANGGGIVSEFPPQMPSMSWNFPRRNRIISGLASGVVIVEAGIKSGSLITAKYAIDQDRDLFAIPGSLKNPVSQGPNRLLKSGAIPITEAQDILDHYAHFYSAPKKEAKVIPQLNEVEHSLLQLIKNNNGITLDALITASMLEAPQVLTTLSTLEIYDLIEQLITGEYLPK